MGEGEEFEAIPFGLWMPRTGVARGLFLLTGAVVALPAAGFGLVALLCLTGAFARTGGQPAFGPGYGALALALAALPPASVRLYQGVAAVRRPVRWAG
jgi:hypothetical protein